MRRAEIYDRKRKSGNDVSAAEKGATGDEADNEPEREMRVPQYTEVDHRPALLNAAPPGAEKPQPDHTADREKDERWFLEDRTSGVTGNSMTLRVYNGATHNNQK